MIRRRPGLIAGGAQSRRRELSSLIDLLNNPSTRRASSAPITFFHNLGLLGFQFAAVAAKAYQMARANGVELEMSTARYYRTLWTELTAEAAENRSVL
jgi:hypothetical protein